MNFNFQLRKTYSVEDTIEISVDYGDHNFLIIYGHHINGWFIAIPNWGFSTEAAEPADTFYNTEKLRMTDNVVIREAASPLATAIKLHYEAVGEIRGEAEYE